MSSSFISATANPQQREAITSTDGPLLIIAGPGSGKTFTLVERVVYLITEKGVTPEQLMVVTFTDKAAQELTTRIANRLLAIGVRFNLNEMYLGTFHAICLRWLQEHREFTRLKRNFAMMDQFDQQYFLYQRLRDYDPIPGLDLLLGDPQKASAWHRTETLLKWVNTVSEEALDPAVLIAAPDSAISALGRCAALYGQQLEEANALDFSLTPTPRLACLSVSTIGARRRGRAGPGAVAASAVPAQGQVVCVTRGSHMVVRSVNAFLNFSPYQWDLNSIYRYLSLWSREAALHSF